MYKDNNITLLICGNRIGNSGFETLVNLQSGFVINDKLNASVTENEYYYTIVLRKDISIIVKTLRNVSSYGAMRAGRLRIGVSIPVGYTTNPYSLLNEVERVFKSLYMTDCNGRWQFNNVEPDVRVFEQLLARKEFALRPAAGQPCFVMQGTRVGYIYAAHEEKLLCNLQQEAYQQYSEVIVAATGKADAKDLIPLNPQTGLPTQPIGVVAGADDSNPVTDPEPTKKSFWQRVFGL